ncbi:MAG TPA: type II secretion system protein GspJ [Spirochaetota bacterium]|nr:type II secretion system protein GspJ [Spirochaetota bacterium]HPS85401.1 type II secretion system protein GspJ [Spirochaetota bacterium]
MNFLKKNDGFTLIEMLVATAVSSVILVMVYTAYASIIRSVNQGKIASQYYEELNLILRRIDSDLLNTYWNETAKNISFISEIEGNSSRLNFVTGEYKSNRMILSVKDNFPSSDIHEVGYYLKRDNKTGKNNLIRRSEIHYDSSPLDGGIEEVIFRNVESIRFDFKYRSDWIDTWDTREKKRLPSGIKTTLVVIDPYNNKDTYEFFTICNMSYE